MELIEILRTVTEGKIYVENERARVTRTLASIYEKDDEREKAAKVLQELQVPSNFSLFTWISTTLIFDFFASGIHSIWTTTLCLCRWKHSARWRRRRKWSLFWSRCDSVSRQRTTFELRLSARKSAPSTSRGRTLRSSNWGEIFVCVYVCECVSVSLCINVSVCVCVCVCED